MGARVAAGVCQWGPAGASAALIVHTERKGGVALVKMLKGRVVVITPLRVPTARLVEGDASQTAPPTPTTATLTLAHQGCTPHRRQGREGHGA
eukprot:gene29394-41655_t